MFPYEQASNTQKKIYFCEGCHKPKLSWQGACTKCWKKSKNLPAPNNAE